MYRSFLPKRELSFQKSFMVLLILGILLFTIYLGFARASLDRLIVIEALDICSTITSLGSNLIANGGAEADTGAGDANNIVPPSCWSTTGSFTIMKYGTPEFPNVGAVPSGGVNFFAGGPGTSISTAVQELDISLLSDLIDSGNLNITLSGYFGGYSNQGDNMVLSVDFLSTDQQLLGVVQVGPVLAAERKNITSLRYRSASNLVPVHTRSLQIRLTATRSVGSYNDGYADNISLVLTPCSTPTGLGLNLITNADAESDPGATTDAATNSVSCWNNTSNFTAVNYGAEVVTTDDEFPQPGAVPSGGVNFFAGGLHSDVSTATQTINVTGMRDIIDSGISTATLGAYLGGYYNQADQMDITATFKSDSYQSLGSMSIGPVTAADRNNVTGFLPRSANANIPISTRYVDVTMVATRWATKYNDGYADNLSLIVEPGIGTPLSLQSNQVLHFPDAPYAGQTYAHYPEGDNTNTIARWGCYLASAAMIINHWALRSQSTFSTDPGIFDAWLKNNRGYTAWNTVMHAAIARYAEDNGILINIQDYVRGRNDNLLDSYLNAGKPVIIGVDLHSDPASGLITPNHFVVAVGKAVVNGVPTYIINDPVFGVTTLAARWNNDYASILLINNQTADRRALYISVPSSAQVVAIDPQGRKAGLDPLSDIMWDEIPNAHYFLESFAANGDPSHSEFLKSRILAIYSPLDGNYTIEIFSTEYDVFKVGANASNYQGSLSSKEFDVVTSPGSIKSLSIDYNSQVGVDLPVFLPMIKRQE